MTPIINPMWFYWIGVVDGLRGFLTEGVIIILILVVFGFGAYLFFLRSECYDDDEFSKQFTKLKRTASRVLIPLIVLMIVGFFVPSRTTVLQMMAASYTTSDNLETASEVIRETVDYMFDKFEDEE